MELSKQREITFFLGLTYHTKKCVLNWHIGEGVRQNKDLLYNKKPVATDQFEIHIWRIILETRAIEQEKKFQNMLGRMIHNKTQSRCLLFKNFVQPLKVIEFEKFRIITKKNKVLQIFLCFISNTFYTYTYISKKILCRFYIEFEIFA